MKIGQVDDFYAPKKFDWVLIGIIIFFAFISFLGIFWQRIQQCGQARKAYIYQKERLLEEVDLRKDRIITLDGAKMQFEVRNKKIRVLKSDCPQGICRHIGWIGDAGQTIVCLPNQVLVEIKSKGPTLLDAVAY